MPHPSTRKPAVPSSFQSGEPSTSRAIRPSQQGPSVSGYEGNGYRPETANPTSVASSSRSAPTYLSSASGPRGGRGGKGSSSTFASASRNAHSAKDTLFSKHGPPAAANPGSGELGDDPIQNELNPDTPVAASPIKALDLSSTRPPRKQPNKVKAMRMKVSLVRKPSSPL